MAGSNDACVDVITAWCGFVGAWLLVAGAIYQAALDLSEVKMDSAAIRAVANTIPPATRVSPWWWLLPPVAYVKTMNRQRSWRLQIMATLTPEKRAEFLTYSNAALGWFVVGAGAALIGFQEAADVAEIMEWSSAATLPLVVAAAALGLGFTVRRMHISHLALHPDGEATEAE